MTSLPKCSSSVDALHLRRWYLACMCLICPVARTKLTAWSVIIWRWPPFAADLVLCIVVPIGAPSSRCNPNSDTLKPWVRRKSEYLSWGGPGMFCVGRGSGRCVDGFGIGVDGTQLDGECEFGPSPQCPARASAVRERSARAQRQPSSSPARASSTSA